MKSIYGLYDENLGGHSFSIKPYNDDWTQYHSLTRPISLKGDFLWGEVHDLQGMMKKANIWDDFPAGGYTLVSAEIQTGDEDQRVDLLYLRNDGAIMPCELKIGGNAKDAHGQLIRYLSDLYFQKINLDWIKDKNTKFIEKFNNDVMKDIQEEIFLNFISNNKIQDPNVRPLPRTGLLIDEGFTSQVLKAVRYLNAYCGFNIRLMEIKTFVDNGWVNSSEDYMYRIDFNDID